MGHSTQGRLHLHSGHEGNEKSASENLAQNGFSVNYSSNGFAFFATFK